MLGGKTTISRIEGGPVPPIFTRTREGSDRSAPGPTSQEERGRFRLATTTTSCPLTRTRLPPGACQAEGREDEFLSNSCELRDAIVSASRARFSFWLEKRAPMST